MTSIAELRIGHVRYDEGKPPIAWRAHRFARSALVARVRTDDGVTGGALVWCRVPDGAAYARGAVDLLRAAVLNRDALIPFDAGRACQDVASRPGLVRVASLVELALWDVAGRRLGVPCYQLLGCRRRSVPAYAISLEEFGYTATSQYVELAQRFVAQGYRACKFHLNGNAAQDIATCRAIRAAVGDDVTLMLDPAGGYDRAAALAVGRVLEELRFDRIEDPIAAQDFEGYRWLSQRLTVPIAANDPMQWGLRDCAEAARDGLVQCLRIDPARAGIAATMALAAVAETHGADIDFSALAPNGGVEACLHLSLAAGRARWFEKHFAADIDEVPGVTGGVTIEAGIARPSDAPGWGAQFDWPELDRYCTWAD
jgi:L-alanine-DL-glutamate epimerase-like enolase superfamily enzyme